MNAALEDFGNWIEQQAKNENYFAGTFWLLFSSLAEQDFIRASGLQATPNQIPGVSLSTTSIIRQRNGKNIKATFWNLPFRRGNLNVLFSLEKPSVALRPMYRLLARTRGKIHLFPIGHPQFRAFARLVPAFRMEETAVIRGVSYPSGSDRGGADINLRPGNASLFFERLEDEKRILRTVRFRVPTSGPGRCEFTVGRAGYVSYHSGDSAPLLSFIFDNLSDALTNSIKPFERAGGRSVEFQFAEPIFSDRTSYESVIRALSRLPRTSLALLHTNPYFHATLTNYEDGAEFEVFITGHSTISVYGQGDSSPASFLRVQNGLTELFRDATVSLKQPKRYALRDLLEEQA